MDFSRHPSDSAQQHLPNHLNGSTQQPFSRHPSDSAQQPFPHVSYATPTNPRPPTPPPHPEPQQKIDIFEWYPKYQSCQRYFIDHAQHSGPVQAVAAFINICLPFQRFPNPAVSSSSSRLTPNIVGASIPADHAFGSIFSNPTPSSSIHTNSAISLIPYLRRLVVTGLDFPGVLHGFFGDDWVSGVGPLHEQERRNYLFAAKSGGWASVKKDYDMLPLETVPFLRPLQSPVDAEILAAEKSWSEWLAMEDWMVGPRAPESMEDGHGPGMGRGRSSTTGGGPR